MLDDPINRVMHGLLTAYSQYHNRKYKKTGHLFQGRYKSDSLSNRSLPRRTGALYPLESREAKMAARPEDFEYSGHRAYLWPGQIGAGGRRTCAASFRRQQEVSHRSLCSVCERSDWPEKSAGVLRGVGGTNVSSEEFLDEVKHRIGDYMGKGQRRVRKPDLEAILKAARCLGEFVLCSPGWDLWDLMIQGIRRYGGWILDIGSGA